MYQYLWSCLRQYREATALALTISLAMMSVACGGTKGQSDSNAAARVGEEGFEKKISNFWELDPKLVLPCEIPIPAIDETCGALGAPKLLEKPFPLLGGSLKIRGLEGSRPLIREYDIMGAPQSDETETRIFLEKENTKFVIFAQDLHRLWKTGSTEQAQQTMLRKFAQSKSEYCTLPRPPGSDDLPFWVFSPQRLNSSNEGVMIIEAYIGHPDGSIKHISILIPPDIAEKHHAACLSVARAVLQTVKTTDKTVARAAGIKRLPAFSKTDIVVETPNEWRVETQQGPDFTVYYLQKYVPLGQLPMSVGMYLGFHPSADEAQTAAVKKSLNVFGQSVVFWETPTRIQAFNSYEALMQPQWGCFREDWIERDICPFIHFFLGFPDGGENEAFQIIESMRAESETGLKQ